MSEPERDLVGYGANRPTTGFPDGKRLAISLVVNYEEGSERSFAKGDPDQESLTEWGQYPFPPDVRNLAMESMHEYGSRVGVWRILDIFERHDVKSTFFACAVAASGLSPNKTNIFPTCSTYCSRSFFEASSSFV